uniref:helix-turn-helix domain-containing protein n=1 Tax=Brucella cytisi TaxID=407152 RepID=UPI0035DCCA53
MSTPIDDATRATVRQLADKGMSHRAIGRQLGIHHSTVARALRATDEPDAPAAEPGTEPDEPRHEPQDAPPHEPDEPDAAPQQLHRQGLCPGEGMTMFHMPDFSWMAWTWQTA